MITERRTHWIICGQNRNYTRRRKVSGAIKRSVLSLLLSPTFILMKETDITIHFGIETGHTLRSLINKSILRSTDRSCIKRLVSLKSISRDVRSARHWVALISFHGNSLRVSFVKQMRSKRQEWFVVINVSTSFLIWIMTFIRLQIFFVFF